MPSTPSDSEDPYLAFASSDVEMTSFILLESLFCDCESTCTCDFSRP
jgi:hypothetical protein